MEFQFKISTNYQTISMIVQDILLTEQYEIYSTIGLNKLLTFYSISKIIDRATKEKVSFYEITYNNQIIGFAEIEINHLTSLYIMSNFRKMGVGRNFLLFLENEQQHKGNITVFSSPTAIEFYMKLGFTHQSYNCINQGGVLYTPMIKVAKK